MLMSTSPCMLLDQLDQFDPAMSRLMNAWLAARQHTEWALPGRRLRIQWGHAAPDAAFAVAIECTLPGHTVLLRIDGLGGIDPRLVGEPFSSVPVAMRNLVIERIAADFVAALPPAYRQEADIRQVHWAQPQTEAWRWAVGFVATADDGAQVRGMLAASSLHTLEWLHGVLPHPAPTPQALRPDFPVAVRLRLGRTVLPMSTVRGLGVGDVAWIDEGAALSPQGVSLVLIAGNSSQRSWSARLKHRSVELVAPYAGVLAPEPGSTTHRGEHRIMHKELTHIEVPVLFELGEMVLPLAQIEGLHADQTFELAQDAGQATVSLSVFGSVVAEGKLITIGRKLGVRIVRVVRAAGDGQDQSA